MTLTQSEQLFEEYCRRVALPCERVPVAAGKTPDYDILFGVLHVVVEVKEIEPSPPGPTGVTTVKVGERVRHELKKAGKQIKARANGKAPGMLVLFEKQWQNLEPFHIRHAMYGEYTIDLRVPADSMQAPKFEGRRLGGRRQLDTKHNTSISVVCHLLQNGSDDVALIAYHNRHARLPIPPENFAKIGARQYRLPEVEGYGIPDWQEITA